MTDDSAFCSGLGTVQESIDLRRLEMSESGSVGVVWEGLGLLGLDCGWVVPGMI